MSLLELTGVSKSFPIDRYTTVHAVNHVSLSVEVGETLALIGESGSGKSTVARLALRLHQPDDGTVTFAGRDYTGASRADLRAMRARMTVVFQEPYESLDPRMTIAAIVEEPLVIHDQQLSREERRRRTEAALARVSLEPDAFWHRRPAQLSGGQQQRVGIARALITSPQLVVLDEPTASLDLSVRAQILDVLKDLQRQLGQAYLYISHDVETIYHMADRVAVMYFGQIVEIGPAAAVLDQPRHPYTRALLSSVMSVDPDQKRDRLALEGEIPSPSTRPTGCYLSGRCPVELPECAKRPVALRPVGDAHEVACIRDDVLVGSARVQEPR